MPYKDLEHEGNEEFIDRRFSTRKEVIIQQVIQKLINKGQKESQQELAQEKYMNMENPDLWDGEI